MYETGFNTSHKADPTLSQLKQHENDTTTTTTSTPSLTTFKVNNNSTLNAINSNIKSESQMTGANGIYPFADPTLNALNTSDFNTSFDTFVQSIRIASNGEINWNLNDIDTSQFKCKLFIYLMNNVFEPSIVSDYSAES